jgi:hypothetical protein
VCAFVARRRHAEQVSALAGLQLTSIVGVRPTQLAAKAVTSSRLGSRGDGQDRARSHSFWPKTSDCDSVPTYPDPPFADTSTAQFAAQCVRAASHGLADVNGQNLATVERLPSGQRWQSALSTDVTTARRERTEAALDSPSRILVQLYWRAHAREHRHRHVGDSGRAPR